jgi:hypothetical protein
VLVGGRRGCSLVRVSETLSGVENETSWERT